MWDWEISSVGYGVRSVRASQEAHGHLVSGLRSDGGGGGRGGQGGGANLGGGDFHARQRPITAAARWRRNPPAAVNVGRDVASGNAQGKHHAGASSRSQPHSTRCLALSSHHTLPHPFPYRRFQKSILEETPAAFPFWGQLARSKSCEEVCSMIAFHTSRQSVNTRTGMAPASQAMTLTLVSPMQPRGPVGGPIPPPSWRNTSPLVL